MSGGLKNSRGKQRRRAGPITDSISQHAASASASNQNNGQLPSIAYLLLDLIFEEAVTLCSSVMRSALAQERRGVGPAFVQHDSQALVDDLTQASSASKYALLTALHFCRCPSASRHVVLMGDPVDSSESRAVTLDVLPQRCVTRMTTLLITSYQRRCMTADGGEQRELLQEAEELLSSALRALPGTYVPEAEEIPFLAMVFGSDAVVGPLARCGCAHEWGRGVLPHLAASVAMEQMADVSFRRRLTKRCLQLWSRRLGSASVTRPCARKRLVHFADEDTTDSNQVGTHGEASIVDSIVDSAGSTTASLPMAVGTTMVARVDPPDEAVSIDNEMGAVPESRSSALRVSSTTPLLGGAVPCILSPQERETLRKTFNSWRIIALDPFEATRRRREAAALRTCIERCRAKRVRLRRWDADRKRILRTAFERWRYDFIWIHRAELQAFTYHRRLSLSGALRLWRLRWIRVSSARRDDELDALCESYIAAVKLPNMLAVALRHWRLAAKCSNFVKGGVVRRCFSHWARQYRLTVWMRSRYMTPSRPAHAEWDSGSVSDSGLAPRSSCYGPLLGSADVFLNAARARTSLNQWRQQLMLRHANRFRQHVMFRRWHAVATRRTARTKALGVAVWFCDNTVKQRCLAWWLRQLHHHVPQRKVADARRCEVLCRNVLQRWRVRLIARDNVKGMLSSYSSARASYDRSVWFHKWRQRAATSAQSRLAATMLRDIVLRCCFGRWHRQWWLRGCLRQEDEAVANDHCRRTTLRCILRKWAVMLQRFWAAREMALQRRMVQVADDVWSRTLKRRVLWTWRGSVTLVGIGNGHPVSSSAAAAATAPRAEYHSPSFVVSNATEPGIHDRYGAASTMSTGLNTSAQLVSVTRSSRVASARTQLHKFMLARPAATIPPPTAVVVPDHAMPFDTEEEDDEEEVDDFAGWRMEEDDDRTGEDDDVEEACEARDDIDGEHVDVEIDMDTSTV